MSNIYWENNVKGYLSDDEKKWLEGIDKHCDKANLKVKITIEGGNQFHIMNGNEWLCGYMSAENTYFVLKGILIATGGKGYEV